MTTLTRWSDSTTDASPDSADVSTSNPAEIAAELAHFGIRYEQWPVRNLPDGAGSDEVLTAYRPEIDRLIAERGYTVVDVAQMRPPATGADDDWRAMVAGARGKFLAEHTHAEDEVRFFVDGAGIFYLHLDDPAGEPGGSVLAVRCEQGDLLGVPALTRHWFDMGVEPNFTAVRLFLDPDGWVGAFTGDEIATRYPDFDQLSPAG